MTKKCPRTLGIDEHRFTKKIGYATTFCETQPAIKNIYYFIHEFNLLLRLKEQNKTNCREHIQKLLGKIKELKDTPFQALKTLGKTLFSWKEEVVRMFRFSRNTGITEGFHRKMKLIQRRAYGFRNFENYRLRVRVLCC